MPLRFNTLLHKQFNSIFFGRILLVLLLAIGQQTSYAQSNLDATKTEANTLYEAEEFTKAYKLYSILVANYPKDPEYNFRLGVCMIYSEPDKKKCLPYLQTANGRADAPIETKFYLGKAHHINYLFDDAIAYYNEFKAVAPSSLQKELEVDREIKACKNGKRLLSNMSDLIIKSKRTLNEADYFRTYDLKGLGGRLLVKPDEFKTSPDKNKNDKSVMFLPASGERIYYSSYGKGLSNDRDIYYKIRLPDGKFSSAQKVKGINTEFDEDYPFLHPNGTTLYFASKGHNSMGGYDIFRTTYNPATDSWSEPVNMEFPINSPDDDYLYITDADEKTAYFSTGRQSLPGKIDVLKISTERKPIDILAIKGSVLKVTDKQNLRSKITVSSQLNGEVIGIFEAEDNGEYVMELPNGGQLIYTVETQGFKTQTNKVSLPMAITSKPLKQAITYEKGNLKIINNFEEPANDDSYKQYLKVIEKKAKLDVTVEPTPLLASAGNANPVDSTKNRRVYGKTNADNRERDEDGFTKSSATKNINTSKLNKAGLNNKQLSDIANQDAEDARKEALLLRQSANGAMELGKQIQERADKKSAEAELAFKNAQSITNDEEKKIAYDKAIAIKAEAAAEQISAGKMLDYAKALDQDANNKIKVADLNDQYVSELNKTINNKGSDSKGAVNLDLLQKQIEELSIKENASQTVLNSYKNDVEDKENQLAKNEQKSSEIQTAIDEINTEIGNTEKDLAQAKKRKDKEGIQNKIKELKTEKAEKERLLATNNLQIAKQKEALADVKGEYDLAGRLKSEPAVAINNSGDEQKTPAGNKPATDSAIANNQKSQGEDTQPDNAKQQNLPQIADNNKSNNDPSKIPSPDVVSKENVGELSPIVSGKPDEVIKQLSHLNEKMGLSENNNFEYNGYQNAASQSLKIEADTKINEVAAKQKKLKELIAQSGDEIKKLPPPAETKPLSSTNLYKEAEDLSAQAQKLRSQADSKSGAEKDALLTKASEVKKAADEKQLEGSLQLQNENKLAFEINNENLQLLKNQNKASDPDLAEVGRLNNEYTLAVSQAGKLREEANSQLSLGAKLGNLSNAEEKEAEALSKQEQALYILKKTSPNLALKSTKTSEDNSAAGSGTLDLSTQLKPVNEAIADLAAAKLTAYQKLYDANKIELNILTAELKSKQTLIDQTPAHKWDYEAGLNKVARSESQKQTSDKGNNPTTKVDDLVAATKSQVEALNQLTALNNNLQQNVALTPPLGNQQLSAAKTGTTGQNNANDVPAPDKIPTEPQVDRAAPPQDVAKTDTSAAQLVNFFETAKVNLKNPGANQLVSNSLNDIKKSEEELLAIEKEIAKVALDSSAGEPASQLLKKADDLVIDGDNLSLRASDLRIEASSKEGAEKEKLISQAKELEQQSQLSKLEARKLTEQGNSAKLENNNEVISQLMLKANQEHPAAAEQLQQKNTEIKILRNQAQQLRTEANAQSNANARIGSLMNAEEKEAEILQKQNEAIAELRKLYPDFEVKEPLARVDKSGEMEALKKKQKAAQDKQYNSLTYLTNAFSLEYETSKNNVPANLSPAQKSVKQNADALNLESKRLLIKSTQENDKNEKVKLLALAAKTGNASVEQLSQIVKTEQAIAANTTGAKTNNAVITKPNNTAAANPPLVSTSAASKKGTFKMEGLEVLAGDAYSENKPIPMDEKMPDGLIFRVQIGAFKTPLANNTFKGLSPLNGENASNGYIRYTAGNFTKIETARAVKNDLRNIGFKDAFVVIYLNGKRITNQEALAVLASEGKTIDSTAAQSVGITARANVPEIAGTPTQAAPDIILQDAVAVAKELEKIDGLLYTVQIGVYAKQATSTQLFNLKPIYSEKLPTGYYRYTAGIYNDVEKLKADRNRVINIGVSDAFVSAYLNGKRITFAEGKTKQLESTTKMEPESPIIFPEAAAENIQPPVVSNTVSVIAEATPSIQPFSNGVTKYPAATPENGVKEGTEGISYKVQIGAFSRQLPADVVARFLEIKNWPIENTQVNNLVIYHTGNFTSARFAKTLKEEVVQLGIVDAFVTVYRDGKKLFGAEAAALLAQ